MPQRIQRKRTKGWRMPKGAVYVGRGSKYGNPYVVTVKKDGVGDDMATLTSPGGPGGIEHYFMGPDGTSAVTRARASAVDQYRAWLAFADPETLRRELRGKDLACWCPTDQPCHADVLLEIVNRKD